MSAARSSSGKHRKTGAMLAGGALLAWLLLRGSGFGLGAKGGRPSGNTARRVRLRIDNIGITADGVPSTIEEAVEAAKRTGAAEVFATGAARQGTFDDLVAALRAAGVHLWIVGGAHA